MKYLYYPGCSMHSSAKAYDMSFKEVCPYFYFKVEEIKKWTCCMPTAAHAVSKLLSIAIPVSNMVYAERERHNEVLVPCAACFSRFKYAAYQLDKDPEVHKKVNRIVGYDYENRVKVIHPLEIFAGKVTPGFIRRDLRGVRVACYYGCLLTRPPKVKQFPHPENPRCMDGILGDLGFTVVEWAYKTDCCGATLALTRKDIMIELCRRILRGAVEAGADVISAACPLCQMNLETAEFEIDRGRRYSLPVMYFTQLIGLAYGLSPAVLGFDVHLIPPSPVFAERGILTEEETGGKIGRRGAVPAGREARHA